MPARIIHETAITPAEDAAIRALLCIAFPNGPLYFTNTRAYNGSVPSFSAILEEPAANGGRAAEIIAHVGVVDRTLTVANQPLRIAGIQNVAVHPHHRGKNLTAQTMALAMAEAGSRNFDAGLLFCLPELAKLYGRLGWITLPETQVTRIHERVACPLPDKNISMFYPLRHRHFPAGAIHLQGDDW